MSTYHDSNQLFIPHTSAEDRLSLLKLPYALPKMQELISQLILLLALNLDFLKAVHVFECALRGLSQSNENNIEVYRFCLNSYLLKIGSTMQYLP